MDTGWNADRNVQQCRVCFNGLPPGAGKRTMIWL